MNVSSTTSNHFGPLHTKLYHYSPQYVNAFSDFCLLNFHIPTQQRAAMKLPHYNMLYLDYVMIQCIPYSYGFWFFVLSIVQKP